MCFRQMLQVVSVFGTLFSLTTGLSGKTPTPLSLSSYKQARAQLDRCISATGGIERLQQIDDITETWTADIYLSGETGQGRKPVAGAPIQHDHASGRTIIDLKKSKMLIETDFLAAGGF